MKKQGASNNFRGLLLPEEQNNRMMMLIGIIAGIVATLVFLFFFLRRKMFLESESRYGFEETLSFLEKRAGELKWGIPHQYDLQATLKSKGFEVKPVRIFSLCKPDVANLILAADRERISSALMPCRVSVYQRADGKTYISRLNASLFSILLDARVREAMRMAAAENEDIISPLMVPKG